MDFRRSQFSEIAVLAANVTRHRFRLSYSSSLLAQLLIFFSATFPLIADMSLGGLAAWVAFCGVLSVISGVLAVPLRTTNSVRISLFGAMSGVAILLGFIYLPRLLIPKGSSLWNVLYFG